MKLRTKILLAIAIAWAFIFFAVYMGSKKFLEANYLQLENEAAVRSVQQVQQAIDQSITKIATVLRSYAVWDSSYRYSQDRNEAYVEQNLIPPAIAANDFDMMLFYDTAGNLIFQKGLNENRTQEAPVPKELLEALTPGHSLWKKIFQPGMNQRFQGFFETEKGILIIAIHPVLNSKGQGPIYAVVLAGKYFTDRSIQKVAKNTKANVVFYPLPVIHQHPELLKKYDEALNNPSVFLIKTSELINGYSILRDVQDKPLGLLQVKMSRSIFLAGIQTIHNFNLVFLVCGIILALFLFYLLNTLMIKRLKKLNEKVIEIELTRNFSLSLPEEGNDEIASVGVEGNKMLKVIRAYESKNEELINELNHELKLANAFLKKIQVQEALLDDMINSMPSKLIIVNKLLQIKIFNNLVKQQTGISSEEAKGKNLLELLEYLKPYEEKISYAIQMQFPEKIQKVSQKNVNEEVRYLNVLIFPLSQSEEQEAAIRIDDISDQIKLEEKILQNEKFAFIGVLTTGVAHEINEPIYKISSDLPLVKKNIEDFLEILKVYLSIQSETDLSEKLKKAEHFKHVLKFKGKVSKIKSLLTEIGENAAAITDIVRELRVFSRIDENLKKKTNIHEGIDSSLKLLYHRYKNRIEIVKKYGSIPMINAYPGQLNQVFINLLKSAIDEIKEKGVIEIETRQIDEQHIGIYIKDNGVGIDEVGLTQAFSPFAMASKNGKDSLGLSVIQNIVEQHGGHLIVKSEPGKGTTFIVTLGVANK